MKKNRKNGKADAKKQARQRRQAEERATRDRIEPVNSVNHPELHIHTCCDDGETSHLYIKNDGQDVVESNFWDSKYNEMGVSYLSANAGAFRLLLSDAHSASLAEMATGYEVVLSEGPVTKDVRRWDGHFSESFVRGEAEAGTTSSLELLFEDGTEAPVLLFLAREQVDFLPNGTEHEPRPFTVWVKGEDGLPEKGLSLPSYFRRVSTIPYMKPRVS